MGTTIQEMAKKLAPKLRGWINYFTKFRPSEMDYTFWKLNVRIMKWARKKYKLLTFPESYAWLKRVCKAEPNLFVHWSKGFSV